MSTLRNASNIKKELVGKVIKGVTCWIDRGGELVKANNSDDEIVEIHIRLGGLLNAEGKEVGEETIYLQSDIRRSMRSEVARIVLWKRDE